MLDDDEDDELEDEEEDDLRCLAREFWNQT